MIFYFRPDRFAAVIRAAREARGWSLDSLATRIEISKTHLWQIEKGKSIPSVAILARLCKAFELRADYLLFDE